MDTTNPVTHRIYGMSVASVYVHYLAKAARKGRSKGEVDEVICWLTGFDDAALAQHLDGKTSFADFFAAAPRLNPDRTLITGTICGIKVEEMAPGLMQEIRYMDKLVDELGKGRPMAKILRSQT